MKIKYRVVTNRYLCLLKSGNCYSSLNKKSIAELGGAKFPYHKESPPVRVIYKIERIFHTKLLSGGCEVMELSDGVNSYFCKKDDKKYEGNYYKTLDKSYIHENKIQI